ncbi:hypothetical protein C9I50_20890 [Pseudomonas prosekii]|nr:hypothetical protein C9I50_20890 [Pseudomonas prosekii]
MKAQCQPLALLNLKPPSRASSLPHWLRCPRNILLSLKTFYLYIHTDKGCPIHNPCAFCALLQTDSNDGGYAAVPL